MRYKYQGTFTDQAGNIVPSGTVSVFLTGTGTAAEVYIAASGGVSVNSVTSDTSGYFSFWVDVNDYSTTQLFKIKLSKTLFTTKEYDNIYIFPDYRFTNVKDFGALGDGSTDDTTAVQAAIDSVNGEVFFPAGTYIVSSTLRLKAGSLLSGEAMTWAAVSTYSSIIKMADNSDTHMFDTQTSTSTQFHGLKNLTLDGNKDNQGAGTFHCLSLYWWDIANIIDNLKIQEFSGNGILFTNTGTVTGSVDVNKVIIVRCDAGAVKVQGPVQNLTFYDSAFEGNGGAAGSNIVVDSTNDSTTLNLVNCRGELRATASGGGARHLSLDDAGGILINIIGGNYNTGDNYAEHIKVNTSTARINVIGVTWDNVNSVSIINDTVNSHHVTYAQLTQKGRTFNWNIDRTIPTSSTGNIHLIWKIIDGSNNTHTITSHNDSPEGVVAAEAGSLHIRSSVGTAACLYQKISGSSTAGWLPVGRDATISAIADADATPSVAGVTQLKTANTGATTITDFSDPLKGQKIFVEINDANTTIDFTSSGLKGNGGVNWSPVDGDSMTCIYNGADWLCSISSNVSNNIGTLADDATPSIAAGYGTWLTGGTTTITDIDDGVIGQKIIIIAEHSLTITDGTNIFLNGSANFVMTATDTLTLIQKADGLWYELARGDNGA